MVAADQWRLAAARRQRAAMMDTITVLNAVAESVGALERLT